MRLTKLETFCEFQPKPHYKPVSVAELKKRCERLWPAEGTNAAVWKELSIHCWRNLIKSLATRSRTRMVGRFSLWGANDSQLFIGWTFLPKKSESSA
jgi:hypothetical protein